MLSVRSRWTLAAAGLLGAMLPLNAAAAANSPATTRPAAASAPAGLTYDHDGIVRGPRNRKCIALVFTGGSFGDGVPTILDELTSHKIKGSFFVTGEFIRTPKHHPYLKRIIAEGHYLGPHSDGHLLYCPWEDRKRTLVSEAEFRDDLEKNVRDLVALGMPAEKMRYFLPAFEWFNEQIVAWAKKMGLTLINFSPGTKSTTDYLPDSHPRFLSSEAIVRGILEFEEHQPDGLNGFILLTHMGATPERTDKLYSHLGELIDALSRRGYRFVPLDELLTGQQPARAAKSSAKGQTEPDLDTHPRKQ